MKDIGDSTGGAASVALAEALKINTTLQTLRLDGMGVGLEEARRLGHSLRHNSNLRWIKLNPVASLPVFRFRPVEDDLEVGRGSRPMHEHNQRRQQHLCSIDLLAQRYGPLDAMVMAALLRDYAELQRLNLAGNEVGPLGAEELSRALWGHTALQELDLSENKLGPQVS